MASISASAIFWAQSSEFRRPDASRRRAYVSCDYEVRK
jgi:hypothetical protein